MTREEAIALAKTAIAQAHCFPEGRLDRAQVYATSYTTVEHPDDLRWLSLIHISIEEWYRMGGDQITKEVNDWVALH